MRMSKPTGAARMQGLPARRADLAALAGHAYEALPIIAVCAFFVNYRERFPQRLPA